MSFDKVRTFIIRAFSGYPTHTHTHTHTQKQICCSNMPYRNSKLPSIGTALMYDSIKWVKC